MPTILNIPYHTPNFSIQHIKNKQHTHINKLIPNTFNPANIPSNSPCINNKLDILKYLLTLKKYEVNEYHNAIIHAIHFSNYELAEYLLNDQTVYDTIDKKKLYHMIQNKYEEDLGSISLLEKYFHNM